MLIPSHMQRLPLGLHLPFVMPTSAPSNKVAAVQALGAAWSFPAKKCQRL